MELLKRSVLMAAAAVSAATWAIGVTVLQPLSEPGEPDVLAENNTYWARELRWGALIALVLALIALGRGGRWVTVGALITGGAWIGVDLGLDRIDMASGTWQLAAGAVATALVCCAVAAAVPSVPRPGALFTAATVAAVTAGLATSTESPTDTEPALNSGSATVGMALAVVAVAAAVRAAGPAGRPRFRTVVAAGWPRVRTVVAAGAVAATVPWLLRLIPVGGGRLLGILAFTVLLVVTVAVLAAPRPPARRDRLHYGAVAAVTAFALPVLFLPLALVSIVLKIGDPFTALAANPPIEVDEDIVMILLAIPIGLVLGRFLLAFGLEPRTDATEDSNPRFAAGA
ncbi:hypothetical protein [Actinoplanes regularis]|uniref:Uncharacterized protein n=1 Tax=Actinoplanes regularis TaxID=52697 RepID=A0A238VZ58_9ACTN|nr:hypothetical protein [Actinoplanes regularis]GIE91949.1 hypothetical protein Are01nite_84290 [Actinoplanes regularis]SNR39635.1 hypothetical protein SAMN06264365_10215 [Actinoplanes regularis]